MTLLAALDRAEAIERLSMALYSPAEDAVIDLIGCAYCGQPAGERCRTVPRRPDTYRRPTFTHWPRDQAARDLANAVAPAALDGLDRWWRTELGQRAE